MSFSPVNAGARLDRLPVALFHRRLLRLVALGMFFDFFDNAMMASVLGALVATGTSSFALNAQYISVSFFGLTVGAAMAGLMGDRWAAASPTSSTCSCSAACASRPRSPRR